MMPTALDRCYGRRVWQYAELYQKKLVVLEESIDGRHHVKVRCDELPGELERLDHRNRRGDVRMIITD
jgi:hypothetical protein